MSIDHSPTRIRPWVWLAASALASIGACGVVHWSSWSEYRSVETLPGTVFQVELPSTSGPFDWFSVYAIEHEGPAIVVINPESGSRPRALRVFRFPSGEKLEELLDYSAADVARIEVERRLVPPFDFDGDGAADAIVAGDHACRVSAVRGSETVALFESSEPRVYATIERLTPLPDLDGDGCSELAVLQPRDDRSEYDLAPLDALCPATSRLSVVSGALATRAAADSSR
ncbi:MAG: VCBS repeat-containing protein [Planctomycetes bacterium]|nr:VCBS repeat-containing protein [Planctomycetota bacterium]